MTERPSSRRAPRASATAASGGVHQGVAVWNPGRTLVCPAAYRHLAVRVGHMRVMRMPSTPRRRRTEIAEVMRRRVLGGVASGTLRRNDRLPSARELASEFDVDPRLVLSAYRVLSREGIVEIRRRSG